MLQRILTNSTTLINRNVLRKFCRKHLQTTLDINYLCDERNFKEISHNISLRKGVGNIELVRSLKNTLYKLDVHCKEYEETRNKLLAELCNIPNRTHPDVLQYDDKPKILKYINTEKPFEHKPLEFQEISKRLNLARTDQLGNVSGNKSYYFLGDLAQMEHALIQYTLMKLINNKFSLVSVPDILPRNVIESCGMNTRGERTQVYVLDSMYHGPDLCLSGTSEIALAGSFANKIVSASQLPIKLATVSQCYRAETSSLKEEQGIYRVHQFSKVEMFALCKPEQSDELLETFRKFEEDHFSSFGLYLNVLDMPPHELGAQAYRKYDIEVWLPGRKMFGEISSCSNCTDYQSRRLNIRYECNNTINYVHTLNGTACAIPRMLIAILENYQNNNGTITIPEVLRPYMNNRTHIGRQKKVPELVLIKNKK